MFKKIILLCVLSFILLTEQVAFAKGDLQDSNSQEYSSNDFTQMEVGSADIKSANSSLIDYEKVADTEKLQLYVNPKTLAIKVKNKQTGYIWSSTLDNMSNHNLNDTWQDFVDSALTIQYLNAQGKLRTESIISNSSKITFTKEQAGFSANITFKKAKIKMTISVELKDHDITINMPDKKIVEPGKVKLVSANVYPFLGAVKKAEVPGYMFIPDGSGALIRFNNHSPNMESAYSAAVYGDDKGIFVEKAASETNKSYRASIPVFGMVHGENQNAMLGILAEGEHYARIEAYKAGLATEFNWVTAKFTYRNTYKQPTSKNEKNGKSIELYEETRSSFNIKLKFTFLEKENANYVGMAKSYQQHLEGIGVLQKSAGKSPLVRLEFLGGEKKAGSLWDSVVAMTPITSLPNYVNRLSEQDISDFFIIYKGWNDNGLTGSFPDKFPVERKLGTKQDVKATVKKLNSNGIPIYFYTDYVKAYKQASSLFGGSKIAKQVNTKLIVDEENKQEHYLLHPQKAKELAVEDKEKYKSYHMYYLAIDSTGHELYSAFNDGQVSSRKETEQYFVDLLGLLNEGEAAKTALYEPNPYAWKMTDKYLDIPMHSSRFLYATDTVPFLQIVLKGYIDYYAPFSNFTPNQKENLLRLIEYGAYPSFLLTQSPSYQLAKTPSRNIYTSEYNTWENHIIHYYKIMCDSLLFVKDETIDNRQVLADGVVKVTYSNNTSFFINYTNAAFTDNNITVPAKDYVVVKGADGNE